MLLRDRAVRLCAAAPARGGGRELYGGRPLTHSGEARRAHQDGPTRRTEVGGALPRGVAHGRRAADGSGGGGARSLTGARGCGRGSVAGPAPPRQVPFAAGAHLARREEGVDSAVPGLGLGAGAALRGRGRPGGGGELPLGDRAGRGAGADAGSAAGDGGAGGAVPRAGRLATVRSGDRHLTRSLCSRSFTASSGSARRGRSWLTSGSCRRGPA